MKQTQAGTPALGQAAQPDQAAESSAMQSASPMRGSGGTLPDAAAPGGAAASTGWADAEAASDGLASPAFFRSRSSLNVHAFRPLPGQEDGRFGPWLAVPAWPLSWSDLPVRRSEFSRRHVAAMLAAVAVIALVMWWIHIAVDQSRGAAALSTQGATTLSVFAIAVWFWIFTDIDDTYVALGATVLLVVMGVLPEETLFQSLGDDTIWLLLGSFVIAAGITASGLATRAAAFIISGARNPRQLLHLSSAALVATAFAVPSTSGRAALAMPVFLALASVLRSHKRLVLALALLFPSVILLSAVGSYLGAGAHLITSQILVTSNYPAFSFANWMFYGLPLAVMASVVCVELILKLFTTREDRSLPLSISVADLQTHTTIPIQGRFTSAQLKACWLVAAVIVLWCTEPAHGVHPAVVALAGALVMSSASLGVVGLGKALKSVPWSLLIFMAATLAMGSALVTSGAAAWAAEGMLGSIRSAGKVASVLFIVAIVGISTMAHLVIQSRSARSAVLIPVVVSLAPEVGISAVAAAFASTAAAGFCHTLSSSAKPMALYAKVDDAPTYSARDLLRLSAWLAPISAGLVLLFAFLVWPLLGMPLFK
ncbi:MAG: SLC13 family permease [Brachymonas sp.]|nr:SLC13 family permease [Brachymonas sp.]